jgi:hypothetical protein
MERGGVGEGQEIAMCFAEVCRDVKGLGEVGQSENSARYRTWEREYVEQAMPRPIGEKAPLRRLRIERRDWAVSTILCVYYMLQAVQHKLEGRVGTPLTKTQGKESGKRIRVSEVKTQKKLKV